MKTKKAVYKPETQKIQAIALKDISPSETNPRDEFPANSLKELAVSITNQGQLAPIIVRKAKKAGKYEIVCGERRFQAMSKYVDGAKTINAIVRVLTDEEALEIQVIENLQREDVHPLAEAQAFATLLKKKSIDVVAGIIGKSTSYILKRIKLNELLPQAKKWFQKGQIEYGHALLVSRLPVKEQEKVCVFISDRLNDDDNGVEKFTETISELRDFIESTIMLEMSQAPWDLTDKDLYKEAGACSVCPKRTSCNKLLFDDIAPREDLCTDAACFNKKKQLHVAEAFKKLRMHHDPVLSGKEPQYAYGSIQKVEVNGVTYPCLRKTECDFTEPVVLTIATTNKKRLGATYWICRDEKCKKHKKQEVEKKSSAKSTVEKAKEREDNLKAQEEKQRLKDCDRVLFAQLLDLKEKPITDEEMELICRSMLVSSSYSDDTPTGWLMYKHDLIKVSAKEIKDAREETPGRTAEQDKQSAVEYKWNELVDNAEDYDEDDETTIKAKKTMNELLTALLKKYKNKGHLMRLCQAFKAMEDKRDDKNFLFLAFESMGLDPQMAEKAFNVSWEKEQAAKKGELDKFSKSHPEKESEAEEDEDLVEQED